MPSSNPDGKNRIAKWYKKITSDVGTVLDIGPGKGKYSMLLRPMDCTPTVWHGLEIWAPYVQTYELDGLYDEVFIGDARHWCHWSYDLVIAGDVLEHMRELEARSLLGHIRTQAANLFVSVPLLHCDQGPYAGNPYETHVDHWSHQQMIEELSRGPGRLREVYEGPVLGAYWWSRT